MCTWRQAAPATATATATAVRECNVFSLMSLQLRTVLLGRDRSVFGDKESFANGGGTACLSVCVSVSVVLTRARVHCTISGSDSGCALRLCGARGRGSAALAKEALNRNLGLC